MQLSCTESLTNAYEIPEDLTLVAHVMAMESCYDERRACTFEAQITEIKEEATLHTPEPPNLLVLGFGFRVSSVYIYAYSCVCVCMHACTYVYIYTHL